MVLLGFISVVAFIQIIILFIGYSISAPTYSGPKSDHFDGKKFLNPGGVKAKGLSDVLKWAFSRKPGKWNRVTDHKVTEKPRERIADRTRITYINHSTFLIQVDGINILTDPVWSDRVSPFSWIGPKRMRMPGVLFENLPPIDLVLLSHNHYDHLDLSTMKKLHYHHRPKIVTPLGVKQFLDNQKMEVSAEIDWWDEWGYNESLSIQAVPAQHFSGRGMFDRDATLWCGYLIKRNTGNIFFVGDTGYNESMFKEIGERGGKIEAALIPIGAYEPRWFMEPIHTSPEEAIKIHLDVKSDMSIATHFGTFPLADDDQYAPVLELQKAKEKYNISNNQFIIIAEGSHFDIPN